MRVIVCGGRDTEDKGAAHRAALDRIRVRFGMTELVSGGAPGMDTIAETWAKAHGIPIKRFPANWQIYGRHAGPIRNQLMAEYADVCVVFPGGRGTADMQRQARERGLRVAEEQPLPVTAPASGPAPAR